MVPAFGELNLLERHRRKRTGSKQSNSIIGGSALGAAGPGRAHSACQKGGRSLELRDQEGGQQLPQHSLGSLGESGRGEPETGCFHSNGTRHPRGASQLTPVQP